MDSPAPDPLLGFCKIRVLLIEDEAVDAALAEAYLRRSALDVELRLVGTEEGLRRALGEFDPHLVISDFTLSGFDGFAALEVTRQLSPSLPFIFLSDNVRVEPRLGELATDIVRKTDLNRLVPAIERALREKALIDGKAAAESELGESRGRLRDLLNASREWIWEADALGRFTFSTPSVRETLGYGVEQLIGREPLDFVHPDDRSEFAARWQALGTMAAADIASSARWLRVDGSSCWLECSASALRAADGTFRGVRAAARDVTVRREHEEKIARLTRVNDLLSRINTAIVRVDNRPGLLNEACRLAVERGGYSCAVVFMIVPGSAAVAAAAWWGIEDAAVRTRQFAFGTDACADSRSCTLIARVMQTGQAAVCNDLEHGDEPRILPQQDPASRIRSVAALPLAIDGTSVGVLTLHARDVNAFDGAEMKSLEKIAAEVSFGLQYLRHEDLLQRMSYFDTLTGLANRVLWCERLARHIHSEESSRRERVLAVFDLNGLSVINDGFGREVGDRLLQAVAERLRQSEGGSERVAYLGAGVFSVLFEAGAPADDLIALGRGRIESLLEGPVTVDGRDVRVSARIGFARFPADGAEPQALLQNAEVALRRAKYGGEGVVLYSPRLSLDAAARLALEAQLRRSVEQEAFELHYQPIVSARDGRITAVESLLRWRHPEHGLVSAGRIVPLLESLGLIEKVGAWALRRAARDRAAWQGGGLPVMRIAVNVSAAQLQRADFVQNVLAALGKTQPGESWLDLEVTESMLMHDAEASTQKLNQLKSFGVHIAIDDFGTGYSSLSRLASLPITTLKIDRSFVQDIESDRRCVAVVETILSLARALGLRTIAEGIETDAQRKLLSSMGCDELQGYWFARPMAPGDFGEWRAAYESSDTPRLRRLHGPLGRDAGARRRDRGPGLVV